MAEKRSNKDKTARRIDMDRPVNLPVTLPSALKPAQPPKGTKWDRQHSFSEEGLPIAEKQGQESNKTRELDVQRIRMDQPVNQKITLPSAEKPAEPPKGKQPDQQRGSSGEKGKQS